MANKSFFLVTVAGQDNPGITANLMNILNREEVKLADVGQAVTHGLLSLSILLDLGEDGDNSPVLKDLLFESDKMGLNMTYQKIEAKEHKEAANLEKFVLNCVSTNRLTTQFVGEIASLLADNKINIHRIENVTPHQFRSLEIITTLPRGINTRKVKSQLMKISTKHNVDIAFLKDNVFRRSKRLIVFDMDSTLIQTEVIDEIADVAGVGPQVREITERAMNGEIDFKQSLEERVSLLKGLDVSKLNDILEKIPFTPGAPEFIKTVKSLGYKVALISGGFTFFADAFKEQLGLDYAFANELEMEHGKLTGGVVGTIIDADQKALLLKIIAQQEKIALEQTVAIGDGANDLPMLSMAGLGIAFHAKDIVRQEAEQHMSHGPMTSILYFLGIPQVNHKSQMM